jgi:hypothetical protein
MEVVRLKLLLKPLVISYSKNRCSLQREIVEKYGILFYRSYSHKVLELYDYPLLFLKESQLHLFPK